MDQTKPARFQLQAPPNARGGAFPCIFSRRWAPASRCSRCWRRCASTGRRCSPGWARAGDRCARRADRAAARCRCGCSRTGRARCSISWSISSLTCSCRPMRSPRAACCCRWPRRCSASASWSSSALYFADRRMKADDNHFRGFPALWNAAAFYLFLLHPPPALSSLDRRGPDRADFRAVPRAASGPRGAAALADVVADRGLGACWRSTRWPRFRCRRAASPSRSAPSRVYIVGSDAAIRLLRSFKA